VLLEAVTTEEEPRNKSGDKKENDLSTKYSFVGRLFDTILLEIATASGTVKESPKDPDYVIADIGTLAKCFKIAKEVCQAEAALHYSSESSSSHWSVDLSAKLSQAGLSCEKKMKDYVDTMHMRDGGIFRVWTRAAGRTNDDSSSSPYNWAVFRPGK
ncbi:hypothetical protein BGZ65_000652, partial [Modicella reniformis]